MTDQWKARGVVRKWFDNKIFFFRIVLSDANGEEITHLFLSYLLSVIILLMNKSKGIKSKAREPADSGRGVGRGRLGGNSGDTGDLEEPPGT